ERQDVHTFVGAAEGAVNWHSFFWLLRPKKATAFGLPQSNISVAGDRADKSAAGTADGDMANVRWVWKIGATTISGPRVPHTGPSPRPQLFRSGLTLSCSHDQVSFWVGRRSSCPSQGPKWQESAFSPG